MVGIGDHQVIHGGDESGVALYPQPNAPLRDATGIGLQCPR